MQEESRRKIARSSSRYFIATIYVTCDHCNAQMSHSCTRGFYGFIARHPSIPKGLLSSDPSVLSLHKTLLAFDHPSRLVSCGIDCSFKNAISHEARSWAFFPPRAPTLVSKSSPNLINTESLILGDDDDCDDDDL